MYVDIVILATLVNGPHHGYEIRQSAGAKLGTSYLLNNNQLYPVLRRFEAKELVTGAIQSQAGRPDRRIYTLTAKGRRYLQERLEDFTETTARDDREFLTRVYCFHLIKPPKRLEILEIRLSILRNRLERAVARIEGVDLEHYPFIREATDFIRARTSLEMRWIAGLKKKSTPVKGRERVA